MKRWFLVVVALLAGTAYAGESDDPHTIAMWLFDDPSYPNTTLPSECTAAGIEARSMLRLTTGRGLGLYEIVGDRLRMCFGQPDGHRPLKLGTAGTDWVFVCVDLEPERR